MRKSLKWALLCSVFALLLSVEFKPVLAADAGTNFSLDLVPYKGSEYKYLTIPLGAPAPPGFEQPEPAFDDSAFLSGSGAFGSGVIGDGVCPLQSDVHTTWPINHQLFVRRIVSLPAGAKAVRVMVSIDNDIVGVFLMAHVSPVSSLMTFVPFGTNSVSMSPTHFCNLATILLLFMS